MSEAPVRITSQAEFDAAVAAQKVVIVVDCVVTLAAGHARIAGTEGTWGSSRVVARGSSSVEAWGSSSVEAWGSSRVEALDSSSVEAWDSSRVVARDSTRVVARDSSSVEARDSTRVEARDSSSVVALDSSSVEALDSSSVEALDSSSVEALDSSSVEARGSWVGSPSRHGTLQLDNRDDLWSILDLAPNEVGGLRDALVNGRVDGSVYDGECCCIVGTLGKLGARGLTRDSDRPAERLFAPIAPGHTPENSPLVLVVVGWIDQWTRRRAEATTTT